MDLYIVFAQQGPSDPISLTLYFLIFFGPYILTGLLVLTLVFLIFRGLFEVKQDSKQTRKPKAASNALATFLVVVLALLFGAVVVMHFFHIME